jgi:GTPase SAR1 family protein
MEGKEGQLWPASLEASKDDDVFKKDCPDFQYKLILIGNARVGKTCITNRFMDGSFDENQGPSRNV